MKQSIVYKNMHINIYFYLLFIILLVKINITESIENFVSSKAGNIFTSKFLYLWC